ncbi:hypothetical protein [Burkholderia sp. SCN-KJ]|uniref:hypothetical protein n=1 Tax=Burkholderia sp. SCN-KJ TaxID=2969248 RepID=UPI0021502870|nr:hypothetical protein [Burkholderia sp. SCN-KJ]MCR4468719.1 hypothetical protein [Burkholderia sp. SCN-KJ]
MVPIPLVIGKMPRCAERRPAARAARRRIHPLAAKRLNQPAGTLLKLLETSDLRAPGAVDQSG